MKRMRREEKRREEKRVRVCVKRSTMQVCGLCVSCKKIRVR